MVVCRVRSGLPAGVAGVRVLASSKGRLPKPPPLSEPNLEGTDASFACMSPHRSCAEPPHSGVRRSRVRSAVAGAKALHQHGRESAQVAYTDDMQEQPHRNRLGGLGRINTSWTAWGCALVLTGCFNPDDSGSVTESDGSSSSSGPTTGPMTETSSGSTGTSTTSSTATVGETTGTSMGPTTIDPTDPTSTSTTTGMAGTGSETGSAACGSAERCVPAIPADWFGPLVLGDVSCPADYPELGDSLNSGLQPGMQTCQCECGVQSVTCGLWLENEGLPFVPSESCESPDFDDECVSALVSATCSETLVDVPATPTWADEQLACSGAASGAECEDTGTCFPSEAGAVCISRDGEHACPAGFDEAAVYHQGFQDDRSCSACSCAPEGQACSIDVEICSLSFDQETLFSGGDCYQLNSGDGDGVSHQGFNISNNGSCMAGAGTGEVQGAIAETGAVTVCCME